MFVPDIPIMQVDTMNYIYKNKTVDKTNIVTQVNKFKGKTIVQVGDKEITIIEGNNSTSITIIVVAASFVVLLLLGFLARFFWNRMREQKARAE